MLDQAAANVANAQSLDSQGVITWDIEGEQYPQSTSYVCSPDQVAAVAPEMESIVMDSSSPYYGDKLDDAYFKTMTDAGLKAGVCLRPQLFTVASNGTASQVFLSSNAVIIQNLENKAKFAHLRWNATIFYVDSTVDGNGGTLDPAIFQQLITDFPGFLFIPEETTPRYYAYSAPFYSFLFHTTTGTNPAVYNYYPEAFGANLVNDVSAATLATYTPQLTKAVSKGDILMGHADYWQANDAALVGIYQAASTNGTSPPNKISPSITWPTPAALTYGKKVSSTQLNATANTAGTFSYSPSAGVVPGAGAVNLLATFTPSDAKDYQSATASVVLTVNKAKPVITWANPAAITAGSALGGSQLNAKSNVPGSFTFSPALGTIPAAGTDKLSAVFIPTDTKDYSNQTASVQLQVKAAGSSSPQTPVQIVSPSSGSQVSGTIVVRAQCSLTLDAAGSYLLVDGAEVGTARVTSAPFTYSLDTTSLLNGTHILGLWAHDIGNNTVLSGTVTVRVAN